MTITIKGFDDIDVSVDEGKVRIEQVAGPNRPSDVITIAPRSVDELCAAIKEAAADAIKVDEEKKA